MRLSGSDLQTRILQSQTQQVELQNAQLEAQVEALTAQMAQASFAAGYLSFQQPQQQPAPWSYLPQPSLDQSSPPAGKGLTTASDFGENAIRTAGGYTIVPEGKDQAWSIYGPGQQPGETPMSRIWGDPHVQESDGTRWDFSKSSAFRLPDGTEIDVGTTAQEGHSLSSTLTITNGADHVEVSGIDQNKPVVGDITHDGYQVRANQASTDTFTLGGDGKGSVQWFKQDETGRLLGEVVGADYVNGSYEQKVNAQTQYVVDPSLQPPVGTPAWGNMLRDQMLDASRQAYGSGTAQTNFNAGMLDQDHRQNTWQGRLEGFSRQLMMMMQMYSMWNLAGAGRSFAGYSAY